MRGTFTPTYGVKVPLISWGFEQECIWDSPEGGGQRLMVLTAEPGTASQDRLRILASWAASTPASAAKTEAGPQAL